MGTLQAIKLSTVKRTFSVILLASTVVVSTQHCTEARSQSLSSGTSEPNHLGQSSTQSAAGIDSEADVNKEFSKSALTISNPTKQNDSSNTPLGNDSAASNSTASKENSLPAQASTFKEENRDKSKKAIRRGNAPCLSWVDRSKPIKAAPLVRSRTGVTWRHLCRLW